MRSEKFKLDGLRSEDVYEQICTLKLVAVLWTHSENQRITLCVQSLWKKILKIDRTGLISKMVV